MVSAAALLILFSRVDARRRLPPQVASPMVKTVVLSSPWSRPTGEGSSSFTEIRCTFLARSTSKRDKSHATLVLLVAITTQSYWLAQKPGARNAKFENLVTAEFEQIDTYLLPFAIVNAFTQQIKASS